MGNPAVFAVEDHELYRLLIATYLAAFFSGMVDGATFLSSVTSVLTTHLTGATAKGGIYLVNGQADEEGWEMCTYVLVFFSGSLLSGVLTRRGELKSLVLLCNCFLGVGSLLAVCGTMMQLDWEAAKYPALFASGVQNSMVTAITGFARTTHVTGTVTDIGLLMGQGVDPAHRHNHAHWSKCRALVCLLGSFAAGCAASFVASDEELVGMGDAVMFVPAAGAQRLGSADDVANHRVTST